MEDLKYLSKKLYGWDNLRKDMAKKPTFVKGTSIKISQTHYSYPWTFSRSPLECKVPLQSLEKSIIYLLHTLNYYQQQEESKASEMPALSCALSQILDLILEKAPEYFESISGPITVANLLIVIDQCCWRIMQFRNLIDVKSDLMLEENGVKTRKIAELVSENLEWNSMEMVHAAVKNVISRFDEKLEFLNEINDCNDRYNVVNVTEPDYDRSSNRFSGTQGKMFSMIYHKIEIDHRIIVTIKKGDINFSFGLYEFSIFNKSKHFYPKIRKLRGNSMYKNLCALERDYFSYWDLKNKDHMNGYIILLDSFMETFQERLTEIKKKINQKMFFKRIELHIIFRFVGYFLRFFRILLQDNINNLENVRMYLNKCYYVCQNLQVENVLLNAHRGDLFDSLSYAFDVLKMEESDLVKPDLIRITIILCKLTYLSTPTLENHNSNQAFEPIPRSTVVFEINDLPLYRTVDVMPGGLYYFWRRLLSKKHNQTRRDILLNLDVGDCAICLEEIDPKANLYVFPCTHPLCLRCINMYESTKLR